jgi:hypothetical protein
MRMTEAPEPVVESLPEAPSSSAPEPARARNNVPIIVAIAIVGVLVVGGLVILLSNRSQPAVHNQAQTHTLNGTVSLTDVGDLTLGTSPSIGGTDGNCYGTGGYSDMAEGADVTVKDGAGKILATGSLGGGTGSISNFASSCSFEFTVQVPDADFYTVEVSHRGGVNFSHADLESKGWTVSLSLGSG